MLFICHIQTLSTSKLFCWTLCQQHPAVNERGVKVRGMWKKTHRTLCLSKSTKESSPRAERVLDCPGSSPFPREVLQREPEWLCHPGILQGIWVINMIGNCPWCKGQNPVTLCADEKTESFASLLGKENQKRNVKGRLKRMANNLLALRARKDLWDIQRSLLDEMPPPCLRPALLPCEQSCDPWEIKAMEHWCSLCCSHSTQKAEFSFPILIGASADSSICPGRSCSCKNYIPSLKLLPPLIA